MPSEDRYLDTWRAFERIQEDGQARSIGVSNFRVEDLERLKREAEQLPTVNQIELHPSLQQAELRAWHAEHGIATEAWSPLAQGALLDDETIATIAAHHERTPAQVILRWHLQLGNVVIPKSVTPERIRENIEIFDFELERGRHGGDRPPRRRRAHRPRPRHLRRPIARARSGPNPRYVRNRPSTGGLAAGSTRSRRPPSSSAARCSRSGRRSPRATSAGRGWRPASTCVGGVFFSTGGYARCCRSPTAAPAPRRARRHALALVVARAGRLDWLSAVVLFVGTLVFAINLLDSLLGDLTPPRSTAWSGRRTWSAAPSSSSPATWRWSSISGTWLPCWRPRATSAGGSSPSTSSARSSSWSPPSPPSSAPTAT